MFSRNGRHAAKLFSVLLILGLPACATTSGKPEFFFSIPTVSYLRECPDFKCQVVGELYNSDRVKLLEETATGWWRVQSLRSGAVGWTQAALLSPTPLQVAVYYVAAAKLPVRPTPSQEVTSRQVLVFGDRVQKLAESQGWWRVLVEKDRTVGWITADQVTAQPPEKPMATEPSGKSPTGPENASRGEKTSPGPGFRFVAAPSASLHLLPLRSSQVLKTLKLNDKVQSIALAGQDWQKVRLPETGAEGWVESRFLRDSPVTAASQIVTGKKKTGKKPGAPAPPEPAAAPADTLEPEGM
jgi:uncharacterized protein YgiM (DUF1202 family)